MMRQRWMRATPGRMRNMRCSNCGAEFTQWLGFIALRHSFANRMTTLWHAVLLLAVFMAFAFLAPVLMNWLLAP